MEAPPHVLDAARERYGRFEISPSARTVYRTPIRLEVRTVPGRFSSVFQQAEPAYVRAIGPLEVAIEGAVRGTYLVREGRGWIDDASGLGAVDALIRIALSISVPLDGALVAHGAAIPTSTGDAIALCGASGTGKTTAAEAIGSACDEMVVLRPTADGVEVHSTPYWNGFPLRARCRSVICLERGRDSHFVAHHGSRAVRLLTRHVIRYVAIESVDRAILDVIRRICERTCVANAACPEGPAFVPFLGAAMGLDSLPARAAAENAVS